MGNIADKLQTLIQTKSEIRAALQNKGIDVYDSDSFRSYANKINNISQFQQEDAVRFFDYNGDVLHRYTFDEISAMTELPELPSHEGLTCQGWNWTLEDIKQCVSEYGKCDVGAIYISADGKTRLYVRIPSKARTEINLNISSGFNHVTVDWGDGTTDSKVNAISISHNYNSTGEYIITLDIEDGYNVILGTHDTRKMYNIIASSSDSYTPELYKAVIGSGISTLGSYCFEGCLLLTEINIPNSCQNVRISTFSSSGLKHVNIPSGITTIYGESFGYCAQLKTISLPSSMDIIGPEAFYNCTSLISVIAPNIAELHNGAFQGCVNLSQVILGKNLTAILSNAFRDTPLLHKLYLGNNIRSIGDYAFSNSGIEEFTVAEGATQIRQYAFMDAKSLKRIILPNTITSIDQYAFKGCISLSEIIIPDSVTTIGQYAFSNCTALVQVELPKGLTKIADYLFYDCRLKSITIPDSVTTIGAYAFYSCDFQSITIPDSVQTIGSYAFWYNTCLPEIVMPEINTIQPYVFSGTNAGVIDLTKFSKVPGCSSTSFEYLSDCKILVPNHLYNDWKIHDNWAEYKSYITKGFSKSEIYSYSINADKNTFYGSSTHFVGNLECVLYGTHYYGDLESKNYKIPVFEYIGTNKTSEPVSKEISVNYADETFTTTITQEPYVENSVSCVYDIVSVETATQLLSSSFSNYANYFSLMIIDGEEVDINRSYIFNTIGEHSVIFKVKEGVEITNLGYMFYECTALKIADLSELDMSLVTSTSTYGGTSYMFHGCTGLKSVILPESIKYLGYYMFYNCNNVELFVIRAQTAPGVYSTSTFGSSDTTYMGRNYKGVNSFYIPSVSTGYDTGSWTSRVCNSSYCGFIKKTQYIEQDCTSLTITGNNVSGKQTSTIINWTATVNCLDTIADKVVELTFSGIATSELFPQNTSETETVQREISFTYKGVSATTTITQNIWSKGYYTVDLNNQWRFSSKVNPDPSLYEGVYESDSNYKLHNEVAKMYIDIEGYSEFKFYIRSYSEYYDYVRVGTLDKDPSSSRYTTTQGYSNSGTSIGSYRLVTFSNIDGGKHRITIDYIKNGSTNSYDDRGYVLIPIEQ